jgi:hypothetical protein
VRKLSKLIEKREKAVYKIIENKEKINRANIVRYSNLTNNDLNKIYTIIEEGKPFYNDVYILVYRIIDIRNILDKCIKTKEETGKKIYKKVSLNLFIENTNELMYINKLMNKFKNESFVIEFKELIEKYNKLEEYNCKECGCKLNKYKYEKGICLDCLEKPKEIYYIECSCCKKNKLITDFPKDNKNNIGYRFVMCKVCDNKKYLEIRRENAYRYSLTEKGKEIAKKNTKILYERLLCKKFDIKDKTSNTKIKNYKEVNILQIINNNQMFKEHFNEDMTMKEFFDKKRELELEFDHIIPRTFANKVWDKFESFKEVVETKGLEELIMIVSNLFNNERNIQLLTSTENNAKHNNIFEKDYELRDSIYNEFVKEIVNLYLKLIA